MKLDIYCLILAATLIQPIIYAKQYTQTILLNPSKHSFISFDTHCRFIHDLNKVLRKWKWCSKRKTYNLSHGAGRIFAKCNMKSLFVIKNSVLLLTYINCVLQVTIIVLITWNLYFLSNHRGSTLSVKKKTALNWTS